MQYIPSRFFSKCTLYIIPVFKNQPVVLDRVWPDFILKVKLQLVYWKIKWFVLFDFENYFWTFHLLFHSRRQWDGLVKAWKLQIHQWNQNGSGKKISKKQDPPVVVPQDKSLDMLIQLVISSDLPYR